VRGLKEAPSIGGGELSSQVIFTETANRLFIDFSANQAGVVLINWHYISSGKEKS
jgi:hypothetical protein